MSTRSSSPDRGRAADSLSNLTKDCFARLGKKLPSHQDKHAAIMETRLADLRLWADSVGATAKGNASLEWRFRDRQDDLMLVKTMLIMLAEFADDHLDLVINQQATEEALRRVDSTIQNLALIGIAIRRTGKASRRRRDDEFYRPEDYEDFKQHLECMVLLRPSKSGLQDLKTSSLNKVQKRLIEANIRRRHRFVMAQKHFHKAKSIKPKESIGTFALPQMKISSRKEIEIERQLSKYQVTEADGVNQHVPPTLSSLTAASTAEGTLEYKNEKNYAPERARSQITVLAATSDFPQPPPNPKGRRIGKCPCCCQAILVEEMANSERWRQHLVEDLTPYTCIVEDCPTPHHLFSTRKEWEAHLKADHGAQWKCPLCEDFDVVFQSEEEIETHFATQHQHEAEGADHSTLLFWSKFQRMEIASCPLCLSFGREDSPEIIDHILKHVYEFSLRALPWPKPPTRTNTTAVGTFSLPKDELSAGDLIDWLQNIDYETSAPQLQLSTSETEGLSLDVMESDEGFYVPEDEYFDDKFIAGSTKLEKGHTESSKGSDSSNSSGLSGVHDSSHVDASGPFEAMEFFDNHIANLYISDQSDISTSGSDSSGIEGEKDEYEGDLAAIDPAFEGGNGANGTIQKLTKELNKASTRGDGAAVRRLLELILEICADDEEVSTNFDLLSALKVAAAQGHEEVDQLLMEKITGLPRLPTHILRNDLPMDVARRLWLNMGDDSNARGQLPKFR